ncbi:SseB family protein [Haloactinopolyspora alba]|uniref:SseB family protein n=1 Tax=Haloactinopolyspora alba TaxID=648780 RepID=UPI0013ECEC9E|nr:SseB family protein [Haloactinopolyspora alba]
MTSAPRDPASSSPFGDDDGSPDPGVTDALAAFERGEGGSADVLAALAASRLLVPVVPVPDEVPDEAPEDAGEDRTPPRTSGGHADMAAVLTTGRDGRRGLLAFTCLDTMHRWDAGARPSPVPTRSAAEAALADGADALVIDLAGPVMFSIDAPELRSLASGWRPLGTWAGAGSAESRRAEHSDGEQRTARPVRRVRAAGGRLRRLLRGRRR